MSTARARLAAGGVGVLIAAVIVAAIALFAQGGSDAPARAQEPPDAPPASLVRVDAVMVEDFGQTMPVIGRLISKQSVDVAARIAGAVAVVHVQVGDHVEQDDVLAELVTDRLEWELKQSEAELARAESELALRRSEVARLKRLRESAAFQKGRYEDAMLEVATLESAVAANRADLELAKIRLKDAQVRAPFAGTVTMRHSDAGAYLNVGDRVVSLVNDEWLEAEADVPSDRLDGLEPGTPVVLQTQGETYPAVVRALVAEESSLTRTRAVRFELPHGIGDGRLTANQSVTVLLPASASRDVVTVHKDAIVNRFGTFVAFVVKDGIAEMKELDIGESVGNRLEVLSGLAPGDMVVVRGNERLRSGQTVRIDNGV